MEEIAAFAGKAYYENAARILGAFFTDFTEEEILSLHEERYLGRFENDIRRRSRCWGELLPDRLWHGPTCAFRTLLLQLCRLC
jgi:threonine synthase